MWKKEKREKEVVFLGKKRKIAFSENIEIAEILNKKISSNLRNNSKTKIKTKIKQIRKEITDDKKKKNLKKNRKKQFENYYDLRESNIIRATTEDFENPIAFFDKLLDRKKELSGVIKIIPPKEWKENYLKIFEKFYKKKFLEKEFKLDTRMQNLKDLLFGKKFDFSRKFSFVEYKTQADNLIKYFEKTYKKNLQDTNYIEETEKLFWELCQGQRDEKIFYAADLPYMKFFSKRDISDMNQHFPIDSNKENMWTLQNINLLHDSLFQFLKLEEKSNISGLTIPWIYFGMIFSTFCWHVEDLFLYSLNFMHYGSPKIWYSLPVEEKEKMEKFIKKKYNILKPKNENLIEKLTLLIDPIEIISAGIKVNRTVQYPGEIIITLPNSFHAGFSTGFNIAEAVNFSTNKWINYGKMATEEYISQNKKSPVFPIEWLISKNYKFLNNSNFSQSTDKNQLVDLYVDLKKTEKANRKILDVHLKSKKINTKLLELSDDWDYSKLGCALCKGYGFFTLIECNDCFKKCCLNHNHPCECANNTKFSHYNIYYKEFY